MSENPLLIAYERLVTCDALAGSHVSVDRDHRGGEVVNVACDWVEAPGLTHILNVARELELEIVATKGGMRLAEHSNEFSARVRDVKHSIEEHRAEGGFGVAEGDS